MITFSTFTKQLREEEISSDSPLYLKTPEGNYRRVGGYSTNNEGDLLLQFGTIHHELPEILRLNGAWIEWDDLNYAWDRRRHDDYC